MTQKEKLLAAMKANPRGDWSIDDIALLAERFGIACRAPTHG